jgi:hypothetical protein
MAGDPAGLLRKALIAELVIHIWLAILPIALILIGTDAFLRCKKGQPESPFLQYYLKLVTSSVLINPARALTSFHKAQALVIVFKA